MILDLIDQQEEVLHRPTGRFDFDAPQEDPSQLATDLAETMIANKGLGLSANQVGKSYRVFVMTGDPIRAFFNPKLVDVSDEQVIMVEGCLSFPDLFVKVKRPATCRVRYTRPDGETVTEDFAGLSARIVQHEIDHLDGVTFMDRATPFHIEQAKRKLKQRRRKNRS